MQVIKKLVLFWIYINNVTIITKCNMKLFADDSIYLLEANNPTTAANSFNYAENYSEIGQING